MITSRELKLNCIENFQSNLLNESVTNYSVATSNFNDLQIYEFGHHLVIEICNVQAHLKSISFIGSIAVAISENYFAQLHVLILVEE